MPAGWAAGIGAAAGGLFSAFGAESGAQQQANAEKAALAQQQSMFNTVEGNESPFVQAGTQAQGQLNFLLGQGGQFDNQGNPITNSAGGYGSLNQAFNASDFKSLSPQYQFNLQQGGQGVLNNNSSGQGALSGSALKDLISFNQGYANNSFNSAFANYQTQQNNVFNRLAGIAGLGQGAASNQATGASSFANSIGNTQAGIGAALGAGSVAAGNALGSAASNIGGAFGAYGNTGSTVAYTPPDLNMNNEYYANQ